MNELPLIQLIGDPEENFYQLGLKDRETHNEVVDRLQGIIKTPWHYLDKGITEGLKILIRNIINKNKCFSQFLTSYSEGLNRNVDDIALAYLMPEILSGMSKWVPGLPYAILGCSSFFLLDDDDQTPIHGRVLDFPLLDSYWSNERIIDYQINNMPRMLALGTSGLFFPSVTVMTEDGMSLALHQKFTDILTHNGSPIFQIVWDLLKNANCPNDVINFLKKQTSITAWGIYMSFSDGQVVSFDLLGKENYHKIENLFPKKILYKCNQLENPNLKQDNFLPWGISNYNHLRIRNSQDKIKWLKKNKLNSKNLLKVMSNSISKKNSSPQKWSLDTMTPSSLSISTLNPSRGELLTIAGSPPKFYREKYIEISNSWNKIDVKEKKGKKAHDDTLKYQLGIRELMLAQVSHDTKNQQQIYHHLQMANSYLEGYYEQNISKFYFLVFQFIFEKHRKVRKNILSEFKDLHLLPEYLKEHSSLFIFRLETILNKKSHISENNFKNDNLKKVYLFEKKIPTWSLHKATTLLMSPRIDLLDIIYPHISIKERND